MMDERMEERASLYVLGALPPGELAAFEAELGRDAELRQLVEALRISRDALAGSVPRVNPPPALKQKILDEIERREKITPLPASPPRNESKPAWFPWALAACLAVLCAISFTKENKMKEKLDAQAKSVADLNQLADSLQSQTQDLKATVAKLSETNRLENLRIAMLNSLLETSPKAVAVSLWDNREQSGVFLVQNLKPLAADRNYQLWVIDPKYATPVSAGVFQVDAQGYARLEFKTDKLIESANKFAVTEEPKGVQRTPTIKNMVLIGG
jgi:anti-sigma-K factor RskA